jgi:probable rRNA maturation factor
VIVNVDTDTDAWDPLVANAAGIAERAVKAAAACLDPAPADGEVDVVLSTDDEVADLNRQWRGKPKPTNVLSFPAAAGTVLPPGEPRPLGEIILAAGVVAREAAEQRKPLEHHFTHLVVHGFLHIMGYDHENDEEAEQMESLEKEILANLGIPNPYE